MATKYDGVFASAEFNEYLSSVLAATLLLAIMSVKRYTQPNKEKCEWICRFSGIYYMRASWGWCGDEMRGKLIHKHADAVN